MQSWTSVGSIYLSVFLLLLASCRAAGETVYIRASGSGDDQLRKALENQTVDTIVFTSDYSVGSQFNAYDGPVQDGIPMIAINRNVTFTGPPGQPQVLLDLGFVLSAVDLCDTCTFSIHDMAITNDRKGANAQLDFFMGAGNSVINLTNVVRKRLSCTPIGPALQLVERTGRDPKYPAPDGSLKQVYGADDVTFRGKVYPETLHLINYSVNFPRHYNGGYSLLLNNVYRMCDNFFDAKCLLTTEADYCALVHMNELLAEQHGGAASRRLTAGAIAGIAVAAVLGAAGVVAGCVLLVRHRLTSTELKNSIDTSSGGGGGSAGITGTAVGKDLEHGLPADLKVKLEHGLTAAPTAVCAIRGPLTDMPLKGADASNGTRDSGGSNHSNVTASTAAAHHDVPTGNSIGDLRFGILLGAGSFGRVYKARWNGRDVAVKVIEHDIRMAESVANEVQLMLSCNHRNVVRAYHYITINPCRSQTSSLVVKSTDVSSGDHAAASSSADVSFNGTILCNGMGSKAVGRANGPGQRHLQSSGSFETIHSQDVSLQAKHHHHQHHHDQTLPLHQLQLPKLQPEGKLPLPLQQLPVPRPQFAVVEAASSEDWPPMVEQLDESECWDVDNSKTWLIQEYCDGGTLSKLSNSWTPATEGDAQMLKRLALLQDVVRGLAYLHGKNIVHGDLNARNVLVTSSSSAICGFTAKLADLGLSRTIKQHATHHTTCSVGTMSHMPPELLRQGRMSTAVDIYSLGVMMSELYTREVAFRGLHYGQFFETVVLKDMRPRLPPNIPDDYKLLMERCWATEPADRPSARTVLECLGLMISDRQRSLGLPETGSSVVNPGSSCSTGSHSFGGSAAATSSGFVPPWQGI